MLQRRRAPRESWKTSSAARQRFYQRCVTIWVAFLLFSLVSQLQAATALHDMSLPLKPGYYNPSLVVYQGSGWLVARSTDLKWDTTGLKWILNRAYLCQVNITDWSVSSCHDFDPWRGSYGTQCRWGSAEWKVPWEAAGVDDTKLFRWPGRGLWAITGRRPQKPADSIYCRQPVVWRQWLVQITPEGQQPDPELFNYPPRDPAGVTWGDKPGSKAPTSAPISAGAAGRRKLHRWFPLTPAAYSSSTPVDAAPSGPQQPIAGASYRGLYRRHRRRHKHSAAGTVRGGYTTIDEDSLIPEQTRAVTHHYKRHRRPGANAAAVNTVAVGEGLQQERQQQQEPEVLPVQPTPTPTIAVTAPVAAGSSEAGGEVAVAQSQAPPVQEQAQPQSLDAPESIVLHDIEASVLQDAQQLAKEMPGVAPGFTVLKANNNKPIHAGGNAGAPAANSNAHRVQPVPASWDDYWGHDPVSLALSNAKAVYGKDHSINEKNWMPFVWDGRLYFTYKLVPKHVVYLLHPNGTAEPAHETDPGHAFAGLGASASRLHGGPPLVFMDYPKYLASIQDPGIQAATMNQGPYFLGVGHYWLPVGKGDGRTYHHFLIKVEAGPPFRVLQISAELPVQYNQHYKRVAFVSGIDLAMLPAQSAEHVGSANSSSSQLPTRNLASVGAGAAEKQQQQLQPNILISYGSGDWESHVAVMTLADVEQLFMQGSGNLDTYSSTATKTTGASFPLRDGRGYYSMIRKTDNASASSSAGQQSSATPAALSGSTNSSHADMGHEEPYGGLDHTIIASAVDSKGVKVESSALRYALKAASEEVAAAEAKILPVAGVVATGTASNPADAAAVDYSYYGN